MTTATTTPTLEQIRNALATMPAAGPERSARMREVLAMLNAARIDLCDDEGHWHEAEDVMPALDGPSFNREGHHYCDGYWQAAEHGRRAPSPQHADAIAGEEHYWTIYTNLAATLIWAADI